MGRIALSTQLKADRVRSGLRYKLMRFTVTNNNVALPSWFDVTRDILLISGVAPGGGSGGWNAPYYGTGGGSGGAAVRVPFRLWEGGTGIGVVIGAAGTGGGVSANGVAGGQSLVRYLPDNTNLIVFSGGGAGVQGADTSVSAGVGGPVTYLNSDNFNGSILNNSTVNSDITDSNILNQLKLVGSIAPLGLYKGKHGYIASALGNNFNAHDDPNTSAGTPFGGFSGTGYGYGGKRNTGNTGLPGVDGGPGFVALEFIERP